MAATRSRLATRIREGRAPASRPPTRRLLVVEPEALLRWSLETYLSRWFRVFAVESRAAADRILNRQRVDAAVVSDDLPVHDADAVEMHVRGRNAEARVVRTATRPTSEDATGSATIHLEKPFKLAELANLLSSPSVTAERALG